MTALGLTPQMRSALTFIESSIARGVSPSYEEIRVAVGLNSKNGVNRIVYALRERGHIDFIANRSRSIAIKPESTIARDAARYRYLRNRPKDTIGKGGVFAGMTPRTGKGGSIFTEADLDRAVDEAIAKEKRA